MMRKLFTFGVLVALLIVGLASLFTAPLPAKADGCKQKSVDTALTPNGCGRTPGATYEKTEWQPTISQSCGSGGWSCTYCETKSIPLKKRYIQYDSNGCHNLHMSYDSGFQVVSTAGETSVSFSLDCL